MAFGVVREESDLRIYEDVAYGDKMRKKMSAERAWGRKPQVYSEKTSSPVECVCV